MDVGAFCIGSISAVADCSPNTAPLMQFQGGTSVNGSVVGSNLALGGGTTVNFPNNSGDDSDFALWFGFRDNWKEINPGGGNVFTDGTGNYRACRPVLCAAPVRAFAEAFRPPR